jgi:hypothetical protein
MEAYRQIIDLKKRTINLLLPANFKLGKVEVIVFPIEEPTSKIRHKPSDFAGCISKETAEAILKNIEESRNEWERGF